MEAKKRPARKVFFSAKGTRSAKLRFLSEPAWMQDEKEREVLKAECYDLEEQKEVLLEQFCPDAYDLSEALVASLGTVVAGKSAAILARGAVRRTNDGKTVEYLDGFTVSVL